MPLLMHFILPFQNINTLLFHLYEDVTTQKFDDFQMMCIGVAQLDVKLLKVKVFFSEIVLTAKDKTNPKTMAPRRI